MKIITISGEIGWDVTPSMIREQLKAAKGADIDFHISTPGGYVFDGYEIYNLIRDYKRDNSKAELIATVKSIAASMGSYLIANPAFSIVIVEDNSVYMNHNPWSFAVGDQHELRKTADVLDSLSVIIADSYAAKSGGTREEMQELMNAETWLFGQEIVEAGFADEIIQTETGKKDDKKSSIAKSKIIFSSMQEKIRTEKREISTSLNIAALIKEENIKNSLDSQNTDDKNGNQNENNISKIESKENQKNPAVVGKIKTEVSEMKLEDLKKENPELYNDIIQLGVKKEQGRVSELLEMKAQEDFKKIPAICDCIDKAIVDGKEKAETTALVMAVLANGNVQAAIESPDDITSGADTSASGEKDGTKHPATKEA